METPTIIILSAFVPTAAAILGWAKWLHELREKRRERAAKEKAQSELKEVRRRAPETSPYFILSDERFNSIMAPSDDPRRMWSAHPMSTFLLGFMHHEVTNNLPDGSDVWLLVENRGANGHEVSVSLDGGFARLMPCTPETGKDLYAFRYHYAGALRGQEQTLEVSFMAQNGYRDKHKYVTRHGQRALRRIEPI